MALGVLNNLSAIYAENNLNNTNASLQTVLEQLSSGSRINSGADDAAGLSLVNGLTANSAALMQSETNATEGVGLLQVADGALSQVTSLLDRAITLATEASNGTLNSSQEAAANQEYQSILSEVNNIGSTTTYNQQGVFGGNTVGIYTGDSSTEGSSIDELNIRALSQSSVGDTGGTMSYNSGQSNVFLDLSSATQNAQATDSLNALGSSTLTIDYLTKGANGASNPATASITVGGSSGYTNTVDGLIGAINNSGLGLTATFATQAQAGIAGGGAETGIEISGGLISVGVDPSSASTSGTLDPSEITNGNLTLGQVITVDVGGATAASVTITAANNNLAAIAAAINSGAGGAGGVTATVITNNASQATSLMLADSSQNGGALTVTSAAASVAPNALTPGMPVTSASNPASVSFTPGTNGAVGVPGTATLSVAGLAAGNIPAGPLTGSITLSNGSNTQIYAMGTGATNQTLGNVTTLSAVNSTLTGLAAAITGTLGATAVASTSGLTITSTVTGTNITEGASTLEAMLNDTVTSNVAGAGVLPGQDGVTTLSMVGDSNGFDANSTDALAGTLSITNGGATYNFTIANLGGGVVHTGGTSYNTSTDTVAGLVAAINSTAVGVTASVSGGNLVLTATAPDTTVVATGTLTGTSGTLTNVGNDSPTPLNQQSTNITVGIGAPGPGQGSLTMTGDTLTGDISVTNNGITEDFVMNNNGGSTGALVGGFGTYDLTAANSTMTGLVNAINAANTNHGLDATAALDATPGGSGNGVTVTATNGAASTLTIGTVGSILNTASALNFTKPALGGNPQFQSGLFNLEDGGILGSGAGDASSTATDGTLTGTFTLTSVVAGQSVTDTFNMGGNVSADTATTFNTGANTLASLLTAINLAGGSSGNLDLTASQDAASGGIFLQSDIATDSGLSTNIGAGGSLTDTLDFASTPPSPVTYTPAEAELQNAGEGAGSTHVNNGNDLLTNGTEIVLTNSGGNNTATTFLVGGPSGGNTIGVGSSLNPSGETMNTLIAAINGDSALDLHASIDAVTGNLDIASDTVTGGGTITIGADTLTDAYSSGIPIVTPGTAATAPTAATVSMNTPAGMGTSGTDVLGGQLVLTNSSNSTAVTFNLNNNGVSAGNIVDLASANSTLADLVQAISQNVTLGMTASINANTGALQIQSNTTDTTITVGGTGLTDATSEVFTAGATGIAARQSVGTINLSSGNFTAANVLTGAISIGANGSTENYTFGGSGASNTVSGNTVTLSAANSTVAGFEAALNTYQGLSTTVNNGSMTLKSGSNDASPIVISNNTLSDSLGFASATASLGNFASESDSLTGQLNFSVGNTVEAIGSISGMTVNQLINEINYGNTAGTGSANAHGVTASWVSSGNGANGSVLLTSNTYGSTGNILNQGIGTSITDVSTSADLTYTASAAYSIGISNVATTGVYDSSISGESAPTGVSAAFAGFATNTKSGSATATISYSDGAGASLSGTDLLSQTDSANALTTLNGAITDVAAQDGYIGAQINLLNSVSQVTTTQQENVVSAQNAIQATDYASATSNMSKYEILSQTGIAALAQANSVQQEVTKLLQ